MNFIRNKLKRTPNEKNGKSKKGDKEAAEKAAAAEKSPQEEQSPPPAVAAENDQQNSVSLYKYCAGIVSILSAFL